MAKAVIALANGFEEVEGLTAVDLLRRAGVEVTMAAVTDEAAVDTAIGTMVSEGSSALVITGARQIPVVCSCLFTEVDLEEMDMLILPGGMPGTTNLEANEAVMQAIETFDKAGKYVAAICAAPAVVLGKHGYLKGRRATCYPDMETLFEGAEHTTDPVAVSDHIITSRGVGTALEFACTLIEKLCGPEKAEAIAASVVYSFTAEQ